MDESTIELMHLTHGSYFRPTLGAYPWKVVRHVEEYTVVELFGGEEFPRRELLPSTTLVHVDGTLPWLDARDYGAVSIAPEANRG